MTDQVATSEFGLLTSLRQHFAALRQQDDSFNAPAHPASRESSLTIAAATLTSCSCNSKTQSVLLQRNVILPTAQKSHKPNSARDQHQKPFLHHLRKAYGSTAVHKAKAQHRCQNPKHACLRRQQQQADLSGILSASEQQFASSCQGHHAAQCRQLPATGQQDMVSDRFAVIAIPKHTNQLQRCKTPITNNSFLFMMPHAALQAPHSSPSIDLAEPTPHKAAARCRQPCIRAKPKAAWQNILNSADSIYMTHGLCLGHIQGCQVANTLHIASALSKSGQLRAQSMHATVKASKRLMHRFVVRRSTVAQMGVFTTGECLVHVTSMIAGD